MKTGKKGLFVMCVMLALVLAMSGGCTKYHRYHCRSYIQEYVKIDGIETKIEFEKIVVGVIWEYSVNMFSTGGAKLQYDNLCMQNNDMGYNREYEFFYDKTPEIRSIYPDIVDVEIMSNIDFDSAHPAGTSLKDCVDFSAKTYKEFIDNNYPSNDPCKTTTPLNELKEKDLQLLAPYFSLSFNRKPERNKSHGLTITVTDKDGKSYTSYLEYRFD